MVGYLLARALSKSCAQVVRFSLDVEGLKGMKRKFWTLADKLNHKLPVRSRFICDFYEMICLDYSPDDLRDALWARDRPVPWWLKSRLLLRLLRVPASGRQVQA